MKNKGHTRMGAGGGGEANKVHYEKCGSGVRIKLRMSQNRNKQIKTLQNNSYG